MQRQLKTRLSRATGTEGRPEKKEAQVARLVEWLALASVGESTQKLYLSKWQAWRRHRNLSGLGPYLLQSDGVESAVKALTEFMTARCFVYRNQSQTVRGYLAAIKYFHKMFAGWELPTTHCMVVAVGKGIDRAHGKSDIKPRVRKPLTWGMIGAGRAVVEALGEEGKVAWLGVALSYFLLCRASELWAYGNGLVHADFCLTRGDLTFLKGDERIPTANRWEADRVEVNFRASKADKRRVGAVVTRVRGKRVGAFEILAELLDVNADLESSAPLMQTKIASSEWKVISRSEATHALRLLVSNAGKDPMQYALHSGRIGGATQLAAEGASELQIQRAGRWKSMAFMTYVRAGGEGAEFVSSALSQRK